MSELSLRPGLPVLSLLPGSSGHRPSASRPARPLPLRTCYCVYSDRRIVLVCVSSHCRFFVDPATSDWFLCPRCPAQDNRKPAPICDRGAFPALSFLAAVCKHWVLSLLCEDQLLGCENARLVSVFCSSSSQSHRRGQWKPGPSHCRCQSSARATHWLRGARSSLRVCASLWFTPGPSMCL